MPSLWRLPALCGASMLLQALLAKLEVPLILLEVSCKTSLFVE
jgi:hypothetical protein